ncbi:5,6-dimethylbenzimidazole synthase [Algibacillus agarilyticus]|uniref:5,6-dimethylbenzimidazole synthase n=1 Tax=Algibacillus agarilyticus TaxID=2234133 RepID=UPI000DD0666C|nr:5,6-dimethylbenzimidazole synthase [Algibacillus agarilyticus]
MPNKQFTLEDQLMLQDIMQHRRDVRGNNFTQQAVADSVIDQLIQVAALAPSVGFSQPWEFVVIRDDKTKQQVADCFADENAKAQTLFSNEKQKQYAALKLEGIKEAPVNIAVFYKPSDEPVLGQNSMIEMGEYSVVCAVQNMWLMSRTLNIGLGWVSILNPDTVKNILNAPSEHKLVAYLCIGYVEQFLDKPELETLKWAERKPTQSLVHHNGFKA